MSTVSTIDADPIQAGVALSKLEHAYQNRLAAALEHHGGGGKVVGSIGNGLPIEIVLATGFMPVSIAPLPDRPTPHADPWVNDNYDPQLRVILDQLLSGELMFLELAVQVSQSSPDSQVYQAAKEILRQGKGISIPPLYHFSLLGHRHPAAYEYGLMQTLALERRLRSISGLGANEARLQEAITVTNRSRQLLRELNGLRRAGAISGAEGLMISGAGRFLHPQAFGETLQSYLKGKRPKATRSGPRLLVMSSQRLSDTHLHRVLEAAGCTVSAEDDFWGSRSGTADIEAGDDPLQAVFRHYHQYTPNRSIYPATERLSWMYQEAPQADIDGVIFYMPPSDHKMGWDYPRLRTFLNTHQKRSIAIRSDAATIEGAGETTAQVRAFINTL
jgi:benzoyl-CoA reductase/2-hydroxyglutaryl-CoA dehydratase subunit BcrC/BadD/HgdB